MSELQALIKTRKGLTNPKHFDARNVTKERPHCILGEYMKVLRKPSVSLPVYYTLKEKLDYMGFTMSHKRALQILDNMIRRMKKALRMKKRQNKNNT